MSTPYFMDTSRGWQCPRCNAVWAPFIVTCTYCSPQNKASEVPRQPTSGDPLPPNPTIICKTEPPCPKT